MCDWRHGATLNRWDDPEEVPAMNFRDFVVFFHDATASPAYALIRIH